ncbi:Uncharacterised protein [uncultured archaeon]|nr:Uncharacterised protein [uncultured archaeon]
MINKKNRGGELTTQQIVLLIILIASFAVILFFLFRLNLGKTTDAETCHNSIVQRGSGVLPKESVPLNCKTQYVCLTKDGTCNEMTSPQIEKVNTKEDVYNVLANQMADCWWMFGEGKLNYIQDTALSSLYCSICDQVAFDKSVNNIFASGEIDQNDFYNYLSTHNASGKDVNYLEYLTGVTISHSIITAVKDGSADLGKINLNNQYYIMTGIFNKVSILTWIGGGVAVGGAIGVAIVSGGASIPLTLAIIGGSTIGGTAGYFIGTKVKGPSGNDYIPPTLIGANSEDFNKLKCASIKTIG